MDPARSLNGESAADPRATLAWWHFDAPEGELTLDIHVQPGASKTAFAGTHGERLKVRIAARPVEGEANRELAGFLARYLEVPQRSVTIVRGLTGRSKTVRISGVADVAARRVLAEG
ncbi:MAG: YggU family protein [Betaproteobacteria bacterium]|nr:YggU family protein [Betaproteobacteria bacterium]